MIAAIASITIGVVVYSTYIATNKPTSRPSYNVNSTNTPSTTNPSPPSTTIRPGVNFTVTNNGNSLFFNQSYTDDWLTYHHDFFRTAQDPYNLSSSSSSSASPSFTSINKNWTSSLLDGAVYAEPLVARGMVFVATENNSIYSLDAGTGKIIWRTNLGPAVPLSDLPCGNINKTGIIGTPVIDISTQTIFVVAFLVDGHHHELFALDIGTGKIRFETAVDPSGSDPLVQQQRSALALSYYQDGASNDTRMKAPGERRGGGIIIYIPFGGLFGDCGSYHGWMVGAPIPYASLLSNTTNNNNSNTSSLGSGGKGIVEKQPPPLLSFQIPTGREGGIWATSGSAVDHNGNVLVATGNSQSSSTFDFGNSVIKLSPDLGKMIDWFAPGNWGALDIADTDLGSTGPSILDNVNDSYNNNHSATVFQIGKEGIGYLLKDDKLGGINGQIFSAPVCSGGAYGGTAYVAPYLYVPCRDGLVSLYLQPATDANTTTTTTAGGSTQLEDTGISNVSKGSKGNNYGGSNGYTSFTVRWQGPSFWSGPPIVAGGLVWAVDLDNGILYAFDQSTGKVLFKESLGNVTHFTTPSSAHGQVFVAATNKIVSFSLK